MSKADEFIQNAKEAEYKFYSNNIDLINKIYNDISSEIDQISKNEHSLTVSKNENSYLVNKEDYVNKTYKEINNIFNCVIKMLKSDGLNAIVEIDNSTIVEKYIFNISW
jgi:hypothetical protein